MSELTSVTYYVTASDYKFVEPYGDKTKYIFLLEPYGDTMFNFRLELNADDERPTISMMSSLLLNGATSDTPVVLDSYDLSKWPVTTKYFNNRVIYDLDFWFSKKETPLHTIYLPWPGRSIEVIMKETTHIKLIRTNGVMRYEYVQYLLANNLQQVGCQHVEAVYNSVNKYVSVDDYKLNSDKTITFYIKDMNVVLRSIYVVILAQTSNNNVSISYDELRRDYNIQNDICTLYFGDIDSICIEFQLTVDAVVTMLNYKKTKFSWSDHRNLEISSC